jgi:HAD superfamily hydrolase (TIGR01509 family)
MGAMKAVLFDWRGTLVLDPPTEWWVERALSRLGRNASTFEIEHLVLKLDDAYLAPEVQAGLLIEDCDVQFHRNVNLRWFEIAGLDEELSVELYELDFDPECHPFYPDVPDVLAALHSAGIGLAVVSDIHFDLRPEFSAADLDQYIDAYVLSFEEGFQKPDARMFQLALNHLDVTPSEALVVGDRSSHDGGAASVGITTMILPPLQTLLDRGLRSILDLCGLGTTSDPSPPKQ